MESNKTIWGFHALIEQEPFLVERGYIGIGWAEIGSLADAKDRDAVKKLYKKAFPADSDGRVNTCAGTLHRFANEMRAGDIVVFTRKGGDKDVLIGELSGDYQFLNGENKAYPHLRKIRWKKTLPREFFSQGALYELGSFLTLIQVKEYADEVLAALEGKNVDVPAEEMYAVEEIDYEQQARDFVKKQLLRHEKGHGLARLFAHLLEILGYHTDISEPGKDGGIDIVAYPDELGVRRPLIKVQCKSSKVGPDEVGRLNGLLNEEEQGILVTLGTFSFDARQLAHARSKIRLIDGDKLIELILQHYEELGSTYKALFPLRKVYVPEATNE